MTDGWVVQESNAVKTNEPVLLIVNLNIPVGNTIVGFNFLKLNFLIRLILNLIFRK